MSDAEKSWVVKFTPGPPAIGVLTTETVKAETENDAREIINNRYMWVMIHEVVESLTTK